MMNKFMVGCECDSPVIDGTAPFHDPFSLNPITAPTPISALRPVRLPSIVGIVQESKHPGYAVGDRVVSHKGWVNYYTVNPDAPVPAPSEKPYKLPDIGDLPNSLGCGALGMPGATAYFGFLELCKPRAGETVVVSGAAGAVGSIVGQIAKIKGCRVIGAGSDDKVKCLKKNSDSTRRITTRRSISHPAVKEAAPNGVDCYYDNIGGELSALVIRQMNLFGRVAVWGSISAYNADPTKMPSAPILQPSIVGKQLSIEGFLSWRWVHRWFEALTELTKWVTNREIKAREHVTEGFDNLVEAFVGMLNGGNFGKAVEKV